MKLLTQEQIASYRAFLEEHNSFIITGHKDPDGDCVSSMLATSALLDALGKEHILVNSGPFKRSEVREYEDRFKLEVPFMSLEDKNECGLLIVDCSELHRMGNVGNLKGFDTFIVDHHRTSEDLSSALTECKSVQSIVDSSSPATVCLVQMLYEAIIGKPPASVAEIMFFGLATDTGFFKFLHNDSEAVFNLAARLVAAGVDPNAIHEKVSSGKPWGTRKLLGTLLSRAERFCDKRLVVTYETLEDTKTLAQDGRDSDLLYSTLLAVDKVQAAVFLRQETPASCTAGFRSKGDIDVSIIAAKFGGGGHKNASGMSADGKIDTLLPQIVREFSKILK